MKYVDSMIVSLSESCKPLTLYNKGFDDPPVLMIIWEDKTQLYRGWNLLFIYNYHRLR